MSLHCDALEEPYAVRDSKKDQAAAIASINLSEQDLNSFAVLAETVEKHLLCGASHAQSMERVLTAVLSYKVEVPSLILKHLPSHSLLSDVAIA